MQAAETSWVEENQRYLTAALARTRAALEAHARRAGEGLPNGGPARPDIELEEDSSSALELIRSTFGLSRFERDILLTCAGVELEASFAALCARAQGDPARSYPTFGLAMAALPGAHWSALTPAAPLRYWRLVELVGHPGTPLTVCPLRIDERILHYLAGIQHIDDRLAGLLEPVTCEENPVPSHQEIAERIRAVWDAAGEQPAAVQLCGADEATRRAVAAAACEGLAIPLLALRVDAIPSSPAERHGLLTLWAREAALGRSALYVDADGVTAGEAPAAGPFVERAAGLVILSTRDRWRVLRRPVITFEVEKPAAGEQRELWERYLAESMAWADGSQVRRLVSQFNLGMPAIRDSVHSAAAARTSFEDPGGALWECARRQAGRGLDELAQRIEPSAGWDDLVLPEAEKARLLEIAAQVAHRARVYREWGFGRPGGRGEGVAALFAGASGTGKTMAAEILAARLNLDLYRIDLSIVVSKYIGETEKNLRRVFDAAESGGVVLFFDEADALFGKRSEVKDSHDRYANIEISYLLQRMESYRGLAILATNMKSALDPAFLRRLRFVVNFPFPDAAQRAEIWRKIFPPAVPLESVDIRRLANLPLAGGNIRNIALNAAFLAAQAGEPVRMCHLAHAVRSEFAKLEKPFNEAEFGGCDHGTVL